MISDDKHDFHANLNISPAAQDKIYDLISEEDSDVCFRAQVVGGGCKGLRYEFSLDVKKDEEDYFARHQKFVLVVDDISYPYLEGSSIGYETSMAGEAFTVVNKKENSRCSCGSSFS